jgi:hypothetical protein
MNLKLNFRGLSFMLVILLAASCMSDETEGVLVLKDHEYMPLQKGRYYIYAITETEYISGPDGETKAYQLKVEITDSIATNGDFFTYVMQLSTKSSADQTWAPAETWSAIFNEREAIVQEGNVSFVKLAIPLTVGRTWNGNLYNTLGEEVYSLGFIAQPVRLGNLNFLDAIEVIQKNDTDPIVGNDVRKEIYARGVGLISRQVETIVYCSNSQSCIGQKIIESGFVKEQVLIEYGRL